MSKKLLIILSFFAGKGEKVVHFVERISEKQAGTVF
jgi:hypothetical protein